MRPKPINKYERIFLFRLYCTILYYWLLFQKRAFSFWNSKTKYKYLKLVWWRKRAFSSEGRTGKSSGITDGQSEPSPMFRNFGPAGPPVSFFDLARKICLMTVWNIAGWHARHIMCQLLFGNPASSLWTKRLIYVPYTYIHLSNILDC